MIYLPAQHKSGSTDITSHTCFKTWDGSLRSGATDGMTATQEISWIARAAVCPTRVTSIQRLFPPTFTVLQSVVWLEAVQLLKCYGAWCLCITLCVFGYLGYLNSTCQLFRV